MRTLTELRKNKIKRNILDNKREYNNPSSISLIAQIIKMQNILLIKWISHKMSLSKNDEEILFDKFLKVNYYCPDIISHEKFLKNNL